MNFQDILSSQGVTEEQYSIIKKEMIKNRIFLTREEKIEERYQKLKLKYEELKIRLEKVAALVTDLRRSIKEKDRAHSVLIARERLSNQLQEKYEALMADVIITAAIRKRFWNTKYPELLFAKIDKSKLSINSVGSVEGIDDQLTLIKAAFQELFWEQDMDDKEYSHKNNSHRISSDREKHNVMEG